MEDKVYSETSADFSQTTRRQNPHDKNSNAEMVPVLSFKLHTSCKIWGCNGGD
jgi:hypothetical protein